MNFFLVLSAIIIVLLVNDDMLSAAKNVKAERSLRVGKELSDEELYDTEERGFWMKIKMRWWLETGKSDEYVKKALKLDELSENDLTSAKNNKYFKNS
ncbi:hypothetical protein F442_03511 [Phytophthora nicotianae P10297]|uniref:RxLR effector protein n=2 Tax=Phytophthora nicotianae TaxID=4792 RepID=W2ZWJ3_PHYNI|nr:hypothetical protein L914_03390 [Phytophthora nicotianae]ETP51346.1 hypothetical protein F442_03511 [Phytophthora nicotianae P10297]